VLLVSLTLVASGMTVTGLFFNPHSSHRFPTIRTSSIAIGPSIQSCNADTSTPVDAFPFQVDELFPAREMMLFSIVDPLLFQRSPPLVPCKKTHLLLRFPCVCPEPVLVKWSVLV
jgi:hypothetical protein